MTSRPSARATLEQTARAVRCSLLPGMTLSEAARRTGVPVSAIRRLRKEGTIRVTRDDLILAALTGNGERSEGEVGDLEGLAAWLDHVNHDGSTAAELARDLDRLAAAGLLVLGEGRFRLLGAFP